MFGNDVVSVIVFVVLGVYIVLFIMGCGIFFGFFVFIIKIFFNLDIVNKKFYWIDFNVGKVFEGIFIDKCVFELLYYCLVVVFG